MSATSSISSTSASSSSTGGNNNSGNSSNNNVLSSTSNIVILDNQILDSNDVVAAAGLQQLSNAGTLKLTRDCAVQYSNIINSYTASSINSSSNSSGNNGNATIVSNNSGSHMNSVNIIPGDASQSNSRVQVLSNVQLVSKGGSHPSTFSYVDASGKNFNVLTSSGKISTNKLISVPITKVKSFNHIGQQQQQQQQPQQHTQIVSSSMVPQQQQQHHQQPHSQPNNVQKVTVPRSIQLVTRIPNSTISVSNGRVSQFTPNIPPSQQQQQQQPQQQQQQSQPQSLTQQFTIQQYPDSSANIPSSLEIRSSSYAAGSSTISSTNVVNTGKAASTKGKNATSLKMMQNSQVGQPIGGGTAAKATGKGVNVSLKSVRNNSKSTVSGINSQYYIKHSSNGTLQQQQQQQQQPGSTTSIYTTSPAQAVYHNPTPHPPQQPMQIPINNPGPTGKGKGGYKSSKNQLIQLQQQHQPPQPYQSPQRSVTPSSSPMPTYGTATGSSSTAMVQGNANVPTSAPNRYQNYNLYSIPVSQPQSTTTTTTSNYKPFNNPYSGANSTTTNTFESSASSGSSSSAATVISNEHPVPSVTVTGYSSSTGKGRGKYNTVVHSESNNPAYVMSPVKTKGRGRNNSLSNYQSAEATSHQRYSASPSRPQQQFQPPPTLAVSNQQQQQPPAVSRDDQIFINGQQMTDETSARLLQSLSQKSSDSGKYSGYKQQQQQQQHFSYYGSDSVPKSPSSSVANSSNPNTTPGIVYDPSDSRFYEDKPDGRRSSTSEVITYADNIPLREGYPATYNYNHRDDDDQIGVEVRPAPVDTSNGRYHILQAVLQDHTYFASLPELKLPEPQPPPPSALAAAPQVSSQLNVSSQQQQHVIATSAPYQSPLHQQHSSQHYSLPQQVHFKQQQQQPPLAPPIVSMAPATVPSNVIIPSPSVPAPLTQLNLNTLTAITSSSSPICETSTTTTTQSIHQTTLDYIYQQRQSVSQDDDANSVISTGSRNNYNMDGDLGEETETAPECEGEDDSVTRCICDLTHDDGYMICCDKCSAWQHVDCMGIDRLNIPDEYNCEMCQPRPVDKNRARMLQLEKRKEQSLFLANNNLQLPVADAAVTSTNLSTIPGVAPLPAPSVKGANQYTTGKAVAGSKKSKSSGGSSKKKTAAEGGTPSAKKSSKKKDDNAANRVNGKRKELKKPSKKKVKTSEQNAEKMTNMIRTWIDNYERAITNHYSPELRARLQAFGKMQSQNPLLNSDRLIPATCVTNLAQKCTTVPHAGGKILISTGDIEPKTPVIEIRGKYMLSSQHKPLQSLFNMAANGKLSNNKNAGPFLFLYQLTNGGMELCVDTRTYGNDARFVRRSCRPNAEILHNIEKGVVHLYIVSTVNIKANTEITIKHDEQLIQRVGGVVILTHTTVTNLCACGLIKECQYSAQLSEGLQPAMGAVSAPLGGAPAGALMNPVGPVGAPIAQGMNPGSGPASKPPKGKKNNGALGDGGEKKPAKKRNSRSTSSNAESRLRSISSSGDSTSEILLYAQQQQQQQMLSPLPQQQQPQLLSPMQQQQQQPSTMQFHQMPSQHLQQQLHFVQPQQQQQQAPPAGLAQSSQPVYMYSPTPASQPQQQPQLQPPVIQPQTPPPMSPVMGVSHRAGFYTEIKSPLNSPPLNLSGGPPPLVIPTMSSPVKMVPQQHAAPMPEEPQQPPQQPQYHHEQHPRTVVVNPSQPTDEQAHLELIQQQQHLHQQQIMEDIMKIKIKSPIASPIKQEYSPSPVTTSMLSPPPPPPIPVAQRLLCAETLKQELFHSHYQPPPAPAPAPVPVQQPPPPPPQQLHVSTPSHPVVHHYHHKIQPQPSPVKLEHHSPPVEFKKEPLVVEAPQPSLPISGLVPLATDDNSTTTAPPPPPPQQVEVKIEPDLKYEPTPVPPVPTTPKEEPGLLPAAVTIKKEEEPAAAQIKSPIKEEPSVCSNSPDTMMEDSKDGIIPLASNVSSGDVSVNASLCDSATNSPVKSSHSTHATSASAAAACVGNTSSGNNSTNSSPHSSHHHHQQGGGSGSKKKSSSAFKDADSDKKEKAPSRKLTREERKMEAIVKAFEKMEQSQQRKQELKEQRKEGKRRSVSSSTPDECSGPSGSASAKKKNLSSQKRKKKKSKSLSQHFGSPTHSRKKKLSKSSKSSKKNAAARVLSTGDNNEHCGGGGGGCRPYESKAAELLLTFSQSGEQSHSTYFGDDVKPLPGSGGAPEVMPSGNSETMPSNLPPLSSACMLVEAAVGPLEQVTSATAAGAEEQDFKLPQKAKTKKSMSREWLSGQAAETSIPYRRVTPDQDSGYMSEEKGHDFRRTAYDEGGLAPLGVEVTDPNMCIVAKKVEEFIAQSSPQPDEAGGGHKWDDKATASSSTTVVSSNVQEPVPAPVSGGNVSESAAAKKRWLRQAISEETDELLTQASSSPPPPNGFTTPLKKRRVIRQSEDTHQTTSVQPQSAPQQLPTLLSAQKIDFVADPNQQPPSMGGTQSYTSTESSSSLYWSNAGPPPLTYPHSALLEHKQAMDLSRSAVPLRQPPRIQPYKIVPIAQALTPLHFTDPDPLPPPPAPAPAPVQVPSLIPPTPVVVPPVQALHHLIPQESHEIIRQPPSSLPQQHPVVAVSTYEPFPPAPVPTPVASAVAAMVPASLLPPDVQTALIQPAQPDVVGSMSYPVTTATTYQPTTEAATAPVRTCPRSKGSQKYIGSPAKFEPTPESPADQVASSSNTSSNNSDVDEDGREEQPMAASPKIEEAEPPVEEEVVVNKEEQPVELEETTVVVVAEEEVLHQVSSNDIESTIVHEEVAVAAAAVVPEEVVEEAVVSKQQQVEVEKETTIVQEEEEVVSSEVVIEQVVEPMEVTETVLTNSVSELEESRVVEEVVVEEAHCVPAEVTERRRPPSPMEVDSCVAPVEKKDEDAIPAVNGREKIARNVVPEEDHEKNELEDLQKVIASFHSENIMNLISRNKKSKKNISRENSSGDEKVRTSRKLHKSKSSSKEGSITPPAPPSPPALVPQSQLDTLEAEIPDLIEPQPPAPPVEPPPPTEEIPISTLGRSYSHPSWHTTTDSFRDTTTTTEVRSYSTLRPDIPQINYNSPSTYQSNAARNLLSSLSTGSEPLSTLGSYRSSTSSFLDYPKSSIGSSTATGTSANYQYRPSTEISTLLEKGFTSSRSSSFSSLSSTVTSERSTERSIGSSFLLSSTKVTENLSTLGSTSSSPYPKIFTKTASSDPRLNPALTVPEPPVSTTPKRKLSINEYRQRKMQSCSASTSASATSSSTTTEAATTTTSNSSSSSSSSRDNSSSLISSSLGSNDVSSSISKELELELELGGKALSSSASSSVKEGGSPNELTATVAINSSSGSGSSATATVGAAEPSSTEGTV